MDKIELIEKFLDSKGLIWVDRKVAGSMQTFYELIESSESDFNRNTVTQIPVRLKNGDKSFTTDIAISVDIISFISYGIAFDAPSCFAVSDEYRDILDENDLSEEWRNFCLKNKGLVYKIAVDNFVEELKKEASEECHKQTLKHIQAITNQTYIKNQIFKMADQVKENIDNQYNKL